MDSMEGELREMARRLRMARAGAGLTQARAAEAARVGQGAISLYERGMRQPHVLTVGRLAVLYGVSVDWLLGLSGEMGI